MHKELYPVSSDFAQNTLINESKYKEMYAHSIKDPESFWGEQAETLHWFKKWDKVKEVSFKSPVSIKWYQGGKLNVSFNCIDRHLEKRGDKVALLWEADSPTVPSRKITYKELHKEVCRFANVLKKMGVKKGDVVTIYMPMIPETAFAMLACARIGAIHSVVFGGFAPDSIADRMLDGESKFVITADAGFRGSKIVPLKENIDKALTRVPFAEKVLVIKYSQQSIDMKSGRDIWYHDAVKDVTDHCEPEMMDAEDPLFILYTSGSTGKPKGVLHSTGGYLLFASLTHKYIFDYHEEDIYWCSADVGWVTGHSYIVYGPLANGATSLFFEGVPNYPTPARFWEIIDKHKVSIFYTSPTAIRSLMREGDEFVRKTSRASLRLLGSVGEPINPEAWVWYHNVVGEGRCPIVDTWWQTETGGIMISPLPGATVLKPGSATLPFFGVQPKLLTTEGQEISGAGEGVLVIADSWPGQARTVYRDHKRFEETYFSSYKGYYFTGDGCRRDEHGYYWITGRVDDVINVSGHRLGTAEIESALVAHPKVAEAAVVGYPHDIKGQGIYAFVTLKTGEEHTDELLKDLIKTVRKEIGPIATPDLIQWAPRLPKTRSGKIMRRILRKIAENLPEQLGDIQTLSDPSVVQELVDHRMNR
ncbi:MAG: acetate--CoA ligase [Pseudobdellovibrionaceae bacterium]